MKRFSLFAAIGSFGLFLISLPIAFKTADAAADPSKVHLSIGPHPFEVEIAASPELRRFGLMYRNFLPEDTGMLFIYPKAQVHCMWMHNTLIPLSVAFVDEKGIILNIEEMKPHTDDNHCAISPARYAIEMPSGWFTEKGIRPGSFINGLDDAPAGR